MDHNTLTHARFDAALDWLSVHYGAFHTERDFQYELAFHLKVLLRGVDMHLEHTFATLGEGTFVDIFIPELRTAIELKYHKGAFDAPPYSLKDAGEQEQGCYRFWQDVRRIERIIKNNEADSGYAILLSNKSSMWKKPQYGTRSGRFGEFRVFDNRQNITGTLNWNYEEGSKARRQDPVHLEGHYCTQWKNYHLHEGKKNGAFRYLLIHIDAH